MLLLLFRPQPSIEWQPQYSEDSLVADSQVLGASLANFLGLPSGGDGQDDDDTYRNAPKPRLFFFVLEAACILIFTVEYVARLLTIGWVKRTSPGFFKKM